MAAPLTALSRHLFGFDRPEASGERFYHRLVETYVVLVSLLFVWRWAALAARLDGVVVPTGMAHYLPITWLQGPAMPYVWAGLLTLLLIAGFVNAWRGAYLAVVVGMHLLHAAHEVLGKVSHASHLVSLALLGFGLAAVLFPARPARGRFALGFTFFFLGFTYGLAALSKLVGTGPSWADGTHLWMWLQEKHIDGIAKLGTHRFNALQRMILGNRRPRHGGARLWLARRGDGVARVVSAFPPAHPAAHRRDACGHPLQHGHRVPRSGRAVPAPRARAVRRALGRAPRRSLTPHYQEPAPEEADAVPGRRRVVTEEAEAA